MIHTPSDNQEMTEKYLKDKGGICGHIRLHHNGLNDGCDIEDCSCLEFKELKEGVK